jgi:hypothetical protein
MDAVGRVQWTQAKRLGDLFQGVRRGIVVQRYLSTGEAAGIEIA